VRAARLALGVLGVTAMGYAVAGAATDPDILPVRHIRFLVVVLALDDGLLLPAFLVIGALVHRFVPAGARAIVQAALVATASLTLVALPLVLGYGRSPDNPSALPRDYPVGLAVVLGAVWLAAAAYLAARSLWRNGSPWRYRSRTTGPAGREQQTSTSPSAGGSTGSGT
jgi:hypothetical protein